MVLESAFSRITEQSDICTLRVKDWMGMINKDLHPIEAWS